MIDIVQTILLILGQQIPGKSNLVSLTKIVNGVAVNTIGVLSTSYALVDPDLQSVFYSAPDTPYDVQTCYDNAIASPLLNQGTMFLSLAGELALYRKDTSDAVLLKALKWAKQVSGYCIANMLAVWGNQWTGSKLKDTLAVSAENQDLTVHGWCVSLAGTETFAMSRLTGDETVASVGTNDTSTPTVVAGGMTFTAGTLSYVELSDGTELIFQGQSTGTQTIIWNAAAVDDYGTLSGKTTPIFDTEFEQDGGPWLGVNGGELVENLLKHNEELTDAVWSYSNATPDSDSLVTFVNGSGQFTEVIVTEDGVAYKFKAKLRSVSGPTTYKVNHSGSATGTSTTIDVTSESVEYIVKFLGKSGGGNVYFGIADGNELLDRQLEVLEARVFTDGRYIKTSDVGIPLSIVPGITDGLAADGNALSFSGVHDAPSGMFVEYFPETTEMIAAVPGYFSTGVAVGTDPYTITDKDESGFIRIGPDGQSVTDPVQAGVCINQTNSSLRLLPNFQSVTDQDSVRIGLTADPHFVVDESIYYDRTNWAIAKYFEQGVNATAQMGDACTGDANWISVAEMQREVKAHESMYLGLSPDQCIFVTGNHDKLDGTDSFTEYWAYSRYCKRSGYIDVGNYRIINFMNSYGSVPLWNSEAADLTTLADNLEAARLAGKDVILATHIELSSSQYANTAEVTTILSDAITAGTTIRIILAGHTDNLQTFTNFGGLGIKMASLDSLRYKNICYTLDISQSAWTLTEITDSGSASVLTE